MSDTEYIRAPNETLATIKNRRSIRNFIPEKDIIDRDIIAILQAANQAPSAHNQQSWRFIVLRGTKKTNWLIWSRVWRQPHWASAPYGSES